MWLCDNMPHTLPLSARPHARGIQYPWQCARTNGPNQIANQRAKRSHGANLQAATPAQQEADKQRTAIWATPPCHTQQPQRVVRTTRRPRQQPQPQSVRHRRAPSSRPEGFRRTTPPTTTHQNRDASSPEQAQNPNHRPARGTDEPAGYVLSKMSTRTLLATTLRMHAQTRWPTASRQALHQTHCSVDNVQTGGANPCLAPAPA